MTHTLWSFVRMNGNNVTYILAQTGNIISSYITNCFLPCRKENWTEYYWNKLYSLTWRWWNEHKIDGSVFSASHNVPRYILHRTSLEYHRHDTSLRTSVPSDNISDISSHHRLHNSQYRQRQNDCLHYQWYGVRLSNWKINLCNQLREMTDIVLNRQANGCPVFP